MFARNVLSVVVLACGMAGCEHLTHVSLPTPVTSAPGYTLTPNEQMLMRQRLGDRERPRLALAMSGGGIRSSLYNFGVLKALYDDGLLADVDLISAVSGGGYLAYWLYSAQVADSQQAFGAPLFADAAFIRNLCKFSGRSNFVPNKLMLPTVMKQFVNWNASRDLYYRRMLLTFGEYDQKANIENDLNTNARLRMVDLQGLIRDHRHPYLVMNASVYGKDPKSTNPDLSRMFELTPLHFGQLGHERLWGANASQPQARLIHVALTSGAAIPLLKRPFFDPFGTDVKQVKLWDGGKTENLGALAVLRRGADAMIVVDAQFDDHGESFSAYNILQKLAGSVGIRVDSQSLDGAAGKTSKQGIYVANAHYRDGRNSRLVYIKMERPTTVMETYRGMPWPATDPRAQEFNRWRTAYIEYDKARGKFKNKSWDCNNPTQPVSVEDLMRFNLGVYLSLVDGNGIWWKLLRNDYSWSKSVGKTFTNNFPRKTTVDQSMYWDEALAYIALGYLTAKGKVRDSLTTHEAAKTTQ